MRAKNIEILADFRRDLINSKCSEKPVKSRPFRDFKGVKNALRGLLLRVSCEFDSRRGCQTLKRAEQGRYTDAVDDILCKVLSAKKRKFKIKYI